jgi:type VI secretion system protein ImpG
MGKYFDNEMRLLQEAAQEFSQAFPEKARMLNMQDIKDRDPYVERLLEGMAFLTAELKQRIDDDVPEIAEALLSHVRPYFLRPFPSCCIMQFKPRAGQMKQATVLPKGTRLTSSTVTLPGPSRREANEKINCRFRTTSEVTIHPLRLNSFRLGTPAHGGQSLHLHFQLDHGITMDQLELDRIKLYLHGDPVTAMALYQAMTAWVEQVGVTFPGRPSRPCPLGGQKAIQPCHLGADNLLVSSSGRSFVGFHLLHEYFCFREKYQFVSLRNLQNVNWPEKCSEFEVQIDLSQPLPEDFRLSKENFRLHCAPAVNLFDTTSEPIQLTHKLTEYPVIADTNHPDSIMIYSINGVTGSQSTTGKITPYSSLPKFNHNFGSNRFYNVSHRVREGLRPMTYLSLGGDLTETQEVLSCDITACNGNIPRDHLQTGDIKAPPKDFPSNVTCENITRPSRMLLPPNRSDYRLALVAHLTVSFNSLSSIDSFLQLLSLYDWSDQEQSFKRIQGVTAISVSPLNRVYRGALLRGMDIKLDINENNYISRADAYMFGTVLHNFFTMYATINTFVQTSSLMSPSKSELTWDPLLGENFLI